MMDDFDKQFSNRYPGGKQPEKVVEISAPEEDAIPEPRQDNDLLAQISANDSDEANKKTKSSHSYMMELVVVFMKLTFILDDAKRKFHRVFDVLSFVWSGIMCLIYAGGLVMLALLIYSYIHFPTVLQESLERQGIKVKTLKVDNYNFSQIVLTDMEGVDGLYSIKKMYIHSTFSDFINRRVKSITLDGVKIKIKADKKGIELGTLPKTLVMLNHNQKAKTVKVNNLLIQNAVLEINGKDFKLPVSFSLTGIYEKDSKISIPLFVKEDTANLVGTLDIRGNMKEMIFTLEVSSGTLTLPRRSPENVTGKVEVVTKNMQVSHVQGDMTLSYGNNAKKVQINFDKIDAGLYKGIMDISYVSSDPYGKEKNVRTTASLNFDGLFFEHPNSISSDKPIKVVIQNFQKQGVNISNLSATLNGKLECQHLDCSYVVAKASPIFIRESSLLFDGDMIRSNNEYSFSLFPNQKKTLTFKDNKVYFDLMAERFNFEGYRNSQVSPVSLIIPLGMYRGSIDLYKGTQSMSVDIKSAEIKTPEFEATQISYTNANLFDEKARIQISASQVKIPDNDLFKMPFRLTLDQKGLDTKAVVSMENSLIQLSFSGVSRLLSGEFKGSVFVHEFDIEKIKTPLHQISSLFPEFVQNQKGKVSALGTVYWKNDKQVTGPLYVSLKDVGFGVNNWKVDGVNAVITLQGIEPLLTPGNQKIFISSFEGPILLQNIVLDGKLDNQFFKLNMATADMAGIDIRADSALFPRKATNATVFFKNNSVDWSSVNGHLTLDDIRFSGKGSVLLPLEFRERQAIIKNAELKIVNGDLGLEGVKDNKIRDFFNESTGYILRAGTLLLNSIESSSTQTLINVSLDGRLIPSQQIRAVRESLEENLSDYIKKVPSKGIPEDILKKQKIIAR